MPHKLVYYGYPSLKKASSPVASFDVGLKDLAKEMLQIMKEHKGVGLAAPQIGVNKRLITITLDDKDFIFVNPKITKTFGDQIDSTEGCLSLPGIEVTVRRYLDVSFEFQNLEGKKITINKVEGLFAIALQHEIDHLDGILLVDKISLLKKLRLSKKLKKIEEMN